MAEYGLFNDKFFLALLKSKTFHHMVAMTIPRMPQIYAAENRTIMAAIARSHGQPETYYAGRDAPEEPMENPEVVPPKPFEKSASLSAIFASSGVNISGWTSMPVVMPVKMDGLGEMPPGAMKAILISDPPAH